MRYIIEARINAGLGKIASLLAQPTIRNKWFKEISKYQLIKGREGTTGAKARVGIALLGDMEIIETILSVEYPNHFRVLYESTAGNLTLDGKLQPCGKATLYKLEHEFTFAGLLNPFAFLAEAAFKKESKRMMEIFKANAEKY